MIGSFSFLEVAQSAFVGETLFVDGMISSYEGDYQLVSSEMVDAGIVSTSSLIAAMDFFSPGMFSYYEGNDSVTRFYGQVDFSDATVDGLSAGPKHHAARVNKDGKIEFNSGFISIGVSSAGGNLYEYVFAEPIIGAEYSVVATSNFNGSNIHCNITTLNSFGFVVETGRSSAKPVACSHSVQVTYN